MFPGYARKKTSGAVGPLDRSPAEERLTVRLHENVLGSEDLENVLELGSSALKAALSRKLDAALEDDGGTLSPEEKKRVIRSVHDDLKGAGPLEPLMLDPSVTDVLVNGPDRVYVERDGALDLTAIRFRDERHLRRVVDHLAGRSGRRIDEASPYVDARLPDGSRLNAVISPVSLDGTTVSIRKPAAPGFDLHEIIRKDTMPAEVALYLGLVVRCGLNVMISGGTGAGKTTLLNALSRFLGPEERVITIEDVAELRLEQENVVRLEARPPNAEGKGGVTQRDCLVNALRMRPDRIIVGEVRQEESVDMLQAMNTGHAGSMTTIHANGPGDAIARLENMVAMSSVDVPPLSLRRQIVSAIQVVVQVKRMEDGTRRVTAVSEINGMKDDQPVLQDVFRFENARAGANGGLEGRFVATGVRSLFEEKFLEHGEALPKETYLLGRETAP